MKKLLSILPSGLLLAGCGTVNVAGKPYPLKTCIVSENVLGSMGRPVTQVHNGQEVKFCCKPCIKKFRRDPAAYLKRIEL